MAEPAFLVGASLGTQTALRSLLGQGGSRTITIDSIGRHYYCGKRACIGQYMPGIGNKCRQYWAAFCETTFNPDTWVVIRGLRSIGNWVCEVVAFEIDFSCSDKVLVERFANWLKQRRKEKGYKVGGTNDLRLKTKSLRAELLNLGAATLLRSGMTAVQAIEYTTKLTGKPLYANAPAWSQAKKQTSKWFWFD